MKLTVFNGSPRYKKSTTDIILNSFLKGFKETKANTFEIAYLVRSKDSNEFIKMFDKAEKVLLAFPLYHDSMPAIVKTFIESLKPFCENKDNPNIGFSVHSGFPEAHHSRYVERYLKKLSKRLGCEYIGTIVKGNMHRVDEVPAFITKRLLEPYCELGKLFGKTGKFDQDILEKLSKPEKFTGFMLWMLKLLSKTPLPTLGWDKKLKKSGTFEKRYAKPYTE
jgi:NAD(P)H-dependent FMN reductase